MSRKAVGALAALLLPPILLASALAYLYLGRTRAPGGELLLRQGTVARAAADELAARGFLTSRYAFVVAARITGADRALQAGRYAIPPGASVKDLIDMLRSGPTLLERVTIPEGSSAREIAAILAAASGVPEKEFLARIADPEEVRRLGAPGPTLEGYLFPETYDFPWGISVEDAVARLFQEYRKVMTPELVARAESLGFTEREVVTLASIIEAETGIPEERARVSAVFHNRLREGWKLEADPTVRYASGNMVGDILVSELEIDSPYNTYRYPGLPPGPIGNPGLASLLAAVNPLSPCADFFFVASGDGGHHFSRTVEEHNHQKALARRRSSRSS